MYKASRELIDSIQKKDKELSSREVARKTLINPKSAERVLNNQLVLLKTLAKVAGVYGLEMSKCYIFVQGEATYNNNTKRALVNDTISIETLIKKIDLLTQESKKSQINFFRSRISGVCTIETYRNSIKNKRFTEVTYKKLIDRVTQLETKLK